jgi:hypothetical protein
MVKKILLVFCFLCCLFLAIGCGNSEPAPGDEDTITVEVVNETENIIISYALLYGPGIDEWGEELLIDEVIEPGELYTFVLPENTYTLILMTYEYYVLPVLRNVSEDQRYVIGGDDKLPVLVVNVTEVDVGTVFISPVELEVWGDDLLGGEVIPAGLGKFFFVEPGTYDFMAQDIRGEIVALDSEIEITQETTFTIAPPEPGEEPDELPDVDEDSSEDEDLTDEEPALDD